MQLGFIDATGVRQGFLFVLCKPVQVIGNTLLCGAGEHVHFIYCNLFPELILLLIVKGFDVHILAVILMLIQLIRVWTDISCIDKSLYKFTTI